MAVYATATSSRQWSLSYIYFQPTKVNGVSMPGDASPIAGLSVSG